MNSSQNSTISNQFSVMRVLDVLVGLLLFLIPTNLFYKLTTQSAYVHGLLSDYLIPKIYLTDLVIGLLLILWLLTAKRLRLTQINQNRAVLVVGISLIILALVQVLAENILASIGGVMRLSMTALCIILLMQTRKKLNYQFQIAVVSLAVIFQSVVAIYQYTFQKSVFGYLFLGETNLQSYGGLAKITINGAEKIAPYGTTAHPNILGGVLAVYTLWLISQIVHRKVIGKKRMLVAGLAIGLGTITISLTTSITSLFIILSGLLLIFWGRKIKPAFLITATVLVLITSPMVVGISSQFRPDNTSLVRRSYLQQAAADMWQNNSLLGVGINNFTTQVETYSTDSEVVRFLQPVHNVGLLWLAETGALGIMLLIFVFYSLPKRHKRAVLVSLLVLLPGLVFDHYMLTINTGQLLVAVTFFFISTELAKELE